MADFTKIFEVKCDIEVKCDALRIELGLLLS